VHGRARRHEKALRAGGSALREGAGAAACAGTAARTGGIPSSLNTRTASASSPAWRCADLAHDVGHAADAVDDLSPSHREQLA
jgi:hypothetical protein